MREIYMISILQLQQKGFSLPRNWQPLAVFSILYVMFLCSLERIGCYEWKETLHLISGMNLDWKLLCRTSMKSLGPLPSLCLWMKRREPHALLLLPPSWGLRPSLCWGTGEPVLHWWNDHDPERHSVPSMHCLRDLSCTFHPAAFTPGF